MGVMGVTNTITQESLTKIFLTKSFRVRSDTQVAYLSVKRLKRHGGRPSFSDFLFGMLERIGDDDDDEDQGNSDWVAELQALDGRITN